MDNVGIVVHDLAGTIDFFRELGAHAGRPRPVRALQVRHAACRRGSPQCAGERSTLPPGHVRVSDIADVSCKLILTLQPWAETPPIRSSVCGLGTVTEAKSQMSVANGRSQFVIVGPCRVLNPALGLHNPGA